MNEAEAMEIASIVVAMLEQPEYVGKSFGVISMFGEEQAMLVDRLLRLRLSETTYAARDILCGISPQFQGDEREVVLLSLVDHAPDGPLRLRKDEDLKKRYNVAASRARDQMWVVHSLSPETDLKEGDLRRMLIKHAQDPQATERQMQQEGERTESDFEQQVLKRLTESGYRVRSQWRVGAFRIDMVVLGADGKRAALECDGDRWHRPDDLDRDLDRQRILERLGWRFVRVRGSEFFRDPEGAMAFVRRRLAELGVEPIGAAADAAATAESELRDRVIRRAEELRQQWAQEEQAKTDQEPQEEPESRGGVTAEALPAPVSVTCSTFQVADIDAGRAVLAALREARVPIGRAEIIERSGIVPQAWTAAIEQLVREGKVERNGSKRGTRYIILQPSETEAEAFTGD